MLLGFHFLAPNFVSDFFIEDDEAAFCLMENPPIIVNCFYDPLSSIERYRLQLYNWFLQWIDMFVRSFLRNIYRVMCFRLWNPATRIISEKLGYSNEHKDQYYPHNLIFDYDDSTYIYKVVYFISDTTHVRVLSLGHNVWRNIQNSPHDHDYRMKVVHFSGSLVWLANHNYISKKLVIISLDLGTEIHTQLYWL